MCVYGHEKIGGWSEGLDAKWRPIQRSYGGRDYRELCAGVYCPDWTFLRSGCQKMGDAKSQPSYYFLGLEARWSKRVSPQQPQLNHSIDAKSSNSLVFPVNLLGTNHVSPRRFDGAALERFTAKLILLLFAIFGGLIFSRANRGCLYWGCRVSPSRSGFCPRCSSSGSSSFPVKTRAFFSRIKFRNISTCCTPVRAVGGGNRLPKNPLVLIAHYLQCRT